MQPTQALRYSELFAQLQYTQDQLTEQTGLCLALVDARGNEITLPSGLPLECSAREHPRYRCAQHHAELIRQLGPNDSYVIGVCPHGLCCAALRTSIRTEDGPVYLLLGRTKSRKAIEDHIDLLRSVYVLPFETPVLEKRAPHREEAHQAAHLPLTPQESKVLACIVEGLSNKEIARSLGISHSTVKAHVANIFRKLQVTNRTEATVHALKNGFGGMNNEG